MLPVESGSGAGSEPSDEDEDDGAGRDEDDALFLFFFSTNWGVARFHFRFLSFHLGSEMFLHKIDEGV